MRVIGGRYRGAALLGPPGKTARPTKDMVREALFNILAGRIDGARFLDLYGGSGAIAIEALSRGAGGVVTVERYHSDLIRKNIKKLRIPSTDPIEVIAGEAKKIANRFAAKGKRFDFIYADPPWDEEMEEETVNFAAPLLDENGILVLEAFHKKEAPRPPEGSGLHLVKSRRYGDTALHFYGRESA